MRKLSLLLLMALLILAVAPAPAMALEIKQGARVHITADQSIDRDLLLTSDSIVIDGRVNGDVFAFGNTVIVNGTIDGNLITAANTVEVRGSVTGSLLSGSNSLSVAGHVGHSLLGATGSLNLEPAGTVARSLYAAADYVDIRGAVDRGIFVGADSFRLDGRVGREVTAYADRVLIGANAAVDGPVTYHSDRDANITQGAKFTEITRRPLPTEWTQNWNAPADWYRSPWLIAIKFGGFLLAGLAFMALFPGVRNRFPGLLVKNPWQTPLAGFLALLAIPVGAVLLLITVIGIPISLLAVVALPLLIYFGQVLMAWTAGRLLADRLPALADQPWPVLFLVGALITTLLVELPFIGGLLGFGLVIYGLGGLLFALVQRRGAEA